MAADYEWLRDEHNTGYGGLPIPSELDARITRLLEDWLEQDHDTRQHLLSQIREQQQFTLLAYSERMASLAVREHNDQHAFLGLLAQGIDGGHVDWRENMMVLSLHHDALLRIGAPPERAFERVASLLPATPAEYLRAFLRRRPESKSLECMGWAEGRDQDGFRYRRTW